jgi:cobalt-zinc-cadmium efflux system outer membrane protein
LGRGLPRPEATETSGFEAPRGDLRLEEALTLALLHNPRLAAFSWEIRAREAEAVQAGSWPNPELSAGAENFAGTGSASGLRTVEITLSLAQLVELGGKRSKRLQRSRLQRDLAAWDYEAARIEVLTATTKAFVAVLAAQEQLTLADELVKVAGGVLQSVTRRVEAGATSAVEEHRARVALETTRIDRERAALGLSVARGELAAQWGEPPPPQFDTVRAALELLAPLPRLVDLAEVVERSPELARWSTELILRQTERDLAATDRVPDLSLGAGLRHFADTDDVGLVAGVSLPLPSFDRKQGAIAAARSRQRQAEHERVGAMIAIRTALQASHAEAQTAFEEATSLRERAIPQANSAFTLAEEAYERGRMSLTDVLDTERVLFELRSRQVHALLRYHRAVADVERLVGVSLSTFEPERTGP